jgi:hypothetical protein
MRTSWGFWGGVIILIGLLLSCSDPFVHSPFEADVKDELKGQRKKIFTSFNSLDTGETRPFKVALISDSHYHFEDLKDAVADIIRHSDYSFGYGDW